MLVTTGNQHLSVELIKGALHIQAERQDPTKHCSKIVLRKSTVRGKRVRGSIPSAVELILGDPEHHAAEKVRIISKVAQGRILSILEIIFHPYLSDTNHVWLEISITITNERFRSYVIVMRKTELKQFMSLWVKCFGK
jgi:hypothetical protein